MATSATQRQFAIITGASSGIGLEEAAEAYRVFEQSSMRV